MNLVYPNPEQQSSFWQQVDRRGPDECWNWTGKVETNGLPYGRLYVNGKLMKAHRLSYIIANGLSSMWDGALVLHRCDNPRCVNPRHLYTGTQKDNTRDMIERGRKFRVTGENNGRAVLTSADVKKIRAAYPGTRIAAIARQYGVKPATICAILTGRNWKGV